MATPTPAPMNTTTPARKRTLSVASESSPQGDAGVGSSAKARVKRANIQLSPEDRRSRRALPESIQSRSPSPSEDQKDLLYYRRYYHRTYTIKTQAEHHALFIQQCIKDKIIPKGLQIRLTPQIFKAGKTNITEKINNIIDNAQREIMQSLLLHYTSLLAYAEDKESHFPTEVPAHLQKNTQTELDEHTQLLVKTSKNIQEKRDTLKRRREKKIQQLKDSKNLPDKTRPSHYIRKGPPHAPSHSPFPTRHQHPLPHTFHPPHPLPSHPLPSSRIATYATITKGRNNPGYQQAPNQTSKSTNPNQSYRYHTTQNQPHRNQNHQHRPPLLPHPPFFWNFHPSYPLPWNLPYSNQQPFLHQYAPQTNHPFPPPFHLPPPPPSSRL